MLTSEIMGLLNEIETKFPVDVWTVDGIKVWPLIRIRLNFELFHLHHTKAVGIKNKKKQFIFKSINIIKCACMHLISSAINSRQDGKTRGTSDVVFLSNSDYLVHFDGQWYEKLCDPLIDICNKYKITYLLMTIGSRYSVPRRSKSKLIQIYLDLIRILEVLKPSKNINNECYLPYYDDFIKLICMKKIDLANFTIEKIIKQISLVHHYESYFTNKLTKLNPSIAYVVCYYSIECMSFIFACKKLNIPTVDLQHGLQGDLHAAYGLWSRVPSTGYELLPSYFWCWSQLEVSSIEKWRKPFLNCHKPLVGGNPWLNIWKNTESEIVKKYDKMLNDFWNIAHNTVKILVTLQPNLDDIETLSPLLNALSKSNSSFTWWIRLHPSMLHKRNNIRKLLFQYTNTNIYLDIPTDYPLYLFLKNSDVHVTHSSSTVIEAEYLGVPSVIFSMYGSEFFPEQIKSGWAIRAEDSIIEAIEGQLIFRSKSVFKLDVNNLKLPEQVFLNLLK